MMRKIFCLALGVAWLIAGPAMNLLAAEGRGNIAVEVTGFRNDQGAARISLFDSAEGFPGHMHHARKVIMAAIINGKALATFQDVVYGVYAIGVIHDENKTGHLPRNARDEPTGGVGASNNAVGNDGPPSFDAAKFSHQAPETRQYLRLHYINI